MPIANNIRGIFYCTPIVKLLSALIIIKWNLSDCGNLKYPMVDYIAKVEE